MIQLLSYFLSDWSAVIPCSHRFELCLVDLNMIDSSEVHYNVQKLFQSLSYVYVVTGMQIKVFSFFLLFSPYLTAKPRRGKLAVNVVLLVCAKQFIACRTWVDSFLLLHFVCLTGFIYRYSCIFLKITRERNVDDAYTWYKKRPCRQKWIYYVNVKVLTDTLIWIEVFWDTTPNGM